jgi:hypothetical protein
MGLVLAAAAVIGVLVTRWLGPQPYARTFGMLAAFVFTAGLAYAGVEAAAMIVWVMLAALLVVWIFTIFTAG